jgi:hypothetical protein
MYNPGKMILLQILSISIVVGCASMKMTAEVGDKIDEDAVQQMVIGKTTRSDVFALLGTPHSIFENQAEFTEGYSVMGFSTVQNRYLSSLGDDRYALLYRFAETSSKSTLGYVVFVSFWDTQIKVGSDELLLLFSKDTDILEDVAYRK